MNIVYTIIAWTALFIIGAIMDMKSKKKEQKLK